MKGKTRNRLPMADCAALHPPYPGGSLRERARPFPQNCGDRLQPDCCPSWPARAQSVGPTKIYPTGFRGGGSSLRFQQATAARNGAHADLHPRQPHRSQGMRPESQALSPGDRRVAGRGDRLPGKAHCAEQASPGGTQGTARIHRRDDECADAVPAHAQARPVDASAIDSRGFSPRAQAHRHGAAHHARDCAEDVRRDARGAGPS